MRLRLTPDGTWYDDDAGREVLNHVVFAEIVRLRCRAAIADSYRELPEQYHLGTLELLVKAAYEHAAISIGRAAELLKCSIVDIREKGWVQGRYDEERVEFLEHEIERLRGIITADDKRLREAALRVGLFFGCDSAEHMADEIERLRAERDRLLTLISGSRIVLSVVIDDLDEAARAAGGGE